MVLRIEVHPKEGARLHRVLAGAQGQHCRLADIEVIELEVEMLLLRVLLAWPLRRLVVVDPLEPQRRTDVTSESNPVTVRGALVDRPAGDRRVELRKGARLPAVDGSPRKSAYSIHGRQYGTFMVGGYQRFGGTWLQTRVAMVCVCRSNSGMPWTTSSMLPGS